MRRTIGLVLVGLGAFLLVLAPMLRFYAYPRIAVAPLDQYTTTVSEGDNVTIFDIGELGERQTDITSTRIVKGDVAAGNDDIAAWDSFVNTADSEGETITAITQRVGFDRTSGAAVEGYGANVNGDPVEFSGQVYKFPFGTEQQDYEFFDSSLLEARPAVYDGEDEIQGLAVYRFVQTIEPTVIAQLEVPGSVVGADEATVEADRVYANTRTLWVEPRTGVIIRGQEEQDSTLRYEGEDRLTVTEGTIGYNDETITANVEEYEPLASQLNLVRNILPLGFAILGLILVVLGALLAAERRGSYAGGSPTATRGEPAVRT